LDYLRYRDNGIIHKGMLPKLGNAFNALQNNVTKVTIGNPVHFLQKEGHTILEN
jgi:acetylglutamate kinase